MSSASAISAAFLLVAVMESGGFSAEEPGAYLAERDGHMELKEPLTVCEEQGGIAGITGTVWAVEPSGKWKVSKFRRDRDGTDHLTPVRSGKISPSELEDLGKSLARWNFSGLPEKAGRE